MIVTLARESLLRSGDDRVGGLVGVTVLIGVGIAVSARVVITRVVCVRIAVIPVSVVIIGIPVRPPWIESEVKDDPGAIDESAMMPAPNVIAAAIPIALPVARMLRYDVVPPVRGKIISTAHLACASSLASQVRNRAISCVRKLRRTIAAIDISARKLTRTDRSARIRMDGLRAELHRSRRTKSS